MAVPKLISGILAELQKKDTFGSFAKTKLKPTGDKKFLFPICLSNAVAIVFICIQIKKEGSEEPSENLV